jgi:acetyltransferase-like isoleucine patch superfamily enzyme/SAM-dependent methyltransferase
METTLHKHRPHSPEQAQATIATRCSLIIVDDLNDQNLAAYVENLARTVTSERYEIMVCTSSRTHTYSRAGSAANVRVVAVQENAGQKELLDAAVREARGSYVLLIRKPVGFDMQVLEESLDEQACCGNPLSVSATGKFVLVERSHYLAAGGFAGLRSFLPAPEIAVASTSPSSVGRVRDLHNREVQVCCGHDTYVDPDVVIDTPNLVKIGSNSVIRKGVVLRAEGGEIVIGDHCVINHYCVFHGKGGIHVGDWTIIAPHCGLYAQNHTFGRFDVPITKQPNVGKGIYLMGDNWIGAGAIVCDDVTLGKGAIIGAGATVSKSIPMASVAVGVPARVIKKRYQADWDFHQRERATCEGMPAHIDAHVQERGRSLAMFVETDDHVLDVGCGEGTVTRLIAQACARVVGCDYSLEAVETARKHVPNAEFVYCNCTALRFSDGTFTKVVLSDVAEHLLPVQLRRTLDEVARVLTSQGALILATPLSGNGTRASTYAHIYEYSQEEISAYLNRAFCDVRLVDRRFGILLARKR